MQVIIVDDDGMTVGASIANMRMVRRQIIVGMRGDT
jgi:hypothetical protein